jgi:hypothetical protein
VRAQRPAQRNGAGEPRLPVRCARRNARTTPQSNRGFARRFFKHLFTNAFVLKTVAKTFLAMLRVQSMLEVFVLAVWATLKPSCSYVAFLRKLYPEVHVLSEDQIRCIKNGRRAEKARQPR